MEKLVTDCGRSEAERGLLIAIERSITSAQEQASTTTEEFHRSCDKTLVLSAELQIHRNKNTMAQWEQVLLEGTANKSVESLVLPSSLWETAESMFARDPIGDLKTLTSPTLAVLSAVLAPDDQLTSRAAHVLLAVAARQALRTVPVAETAMVDGEKEKTHSSDIK
jgi:hypothetical protein